jgi:hypothetical protein
VRARLFLRALADGTATACTDQYMRMVAEFDTGDPRYAWLTQHLFLARAAWPVTTGSSIASTGSTESPRRHRQFLQPPPRDLARRS